MRQGVFGLRAKLYAALCLNRRRRLWCPTNVVLLLLFLIAASPCSSTAYSQSNTFPSRMRFGQDFAVLPAGTARDASADAILQALIQRTGGQSAWRSTQSAALRYTLDSSPASAHALTLVMRDDWSSDRFRYRRGFAGMRQKPQIHDGDSTYDVFLKGSSKLLRVREFDAAHVLASHLPSASAQIILTSPDYRVQRIPQCAAEDRCLAIFRRSTDHNFHLEQRWTLNAKTERPRTIQLWIPDLLHDKSGFWQTVTFLSYEAHGELVIPEEFSIANGTARPMQWKLSRALLNTGIDLDGFAKEVASRE